MTLRLDADTVTFYTKLLLQHFWNSRCDGGGRLNVVAWQELAIKLKLALLHR
jgi:hypothetical protein